MQVKAFSAAAPRIGFVVLLAMVVWEGWLEGWSDYSYYHRLNLHIRLVGIIAWVSSVAWELFSPLLEWPLSRAWCSSLVVMALCMPVVVAAFFMWAGQVWRDAGAGVCLWALGALLFHHGEDILCGRRGGTDDRTSAWHSRRISRRLRAPRVSRTESDFT